MERRRRLMSAEELAQSDAILGEYGIVLPSPELAAAPPNLLTDQLLHRLISVRLWKHILVIIPLLALIIGLSVSVGTMPATTSADQSSIAEWQRGLQSAAGLLFLLSGQLCVIVSWVRARSTIDFRGRYRAWGRFSILLAFGGISLATGILPYLGDVMAILLRPVFGPITAARPALVVVPVTAIAAVILFRVLFDMSRNRAGQGLLATATLPIIAAFAGWNATDGVVSGPFASIAILGGSGLLFSAVLLHCRFVVHRNNDPPKSAAFVRCVAATVEPAIPTSPIMPAQTFGSTTHAAADLKVKAGKESATQSERETAPEPGQEQQAQAETPAAKVAQASGKKAAGKAARRKVA